MSKATRARKSKPGGSNEPAIPIPLEWQVSCRKGPSATRRLQEIGRSLRAEGQAERPVYWVGERKERKS